MADVHAARSWFDGLRWVTRSVQDLHGPVRTGPFLAVLAAAGALAGLATAAVPVAMARPVATGVWLLLALFAWALPVPGVPPAPTGSGVLGGLFAALIAHEPLPLAVAIVLVVPPLGLREGAGWRWHVAARAADASCVVVGGLLVSAVPTTAPGAPMLGRALVAGVGMLAMFPVAQRMLAYLARSHRVAWAEFPDRRMVLIHAGWFVSALITACMIAWLDQGIHDPWVLAWAAVPAAAWVSPFAARLRRERDLLVWQMAELADLCDRLEDGYDQLAEASRVRDRRLSSQLHDQALQTLSAARMTLRSDPEAVRPMIDDALTAVRALHRELSDALPDVQPDPNPVLTRIVERARARCLADFSVSLPDRALDDRQLATAASVLDDALWSLPADLHPATVEVDVALVGDTVEVLVDVVSDVLDGWDTSSWVPRRAHAGVRMSVDEADGRWLLLAALPAGAVV